MSDISYTRTTWADGSEGGTPIDATKLNNIEQGIVDAVAAIGPNDVTSDGTLQGQIETLRDSVSSTTISSILTAGEGFSCTSATYYSFGKIAMLYAVFDVTTAITAASNPVIATLASGKRPHTTAAAIFFAGANAYNQPYISTNGQIKANVNAGLTVGRKMYLASTYILA